VHQRCLAARAIGLLGKHGPSWLAEGVDDDNSPLGRARRHGASDADRRRSAECRLRETEKAAEMMRQLGEESVSEAIEILRDRAQSRIDA
jgi:hypothetical protein